ncbi:MAG: class I SAM-dependent methyltransferase [Pirellulaceae bacterium]|nr:class I SAM-dependent methyltransferase [Pirellulaceae bacterium]
MTGLPQWKLPRGVYRGTWDYLQSQSIAQDYDTKLADSKLLLLDQQFIQRFLPPVEPGKPPPLVADLGCGTGRISRLLSPLGYRMLNVDLSAAMLEQLKRQCQHPHLNECLQANLVELDLITPASVSMAVCLFSTIGMIHGRKNRQQFLTRLHSSLTPGAPLVLHVHNRYHSLWHPRGPSWLLSTWLRSHWNSGWEFGDRVFADQGLPAMFLHIYSRRELLQDLHVAGFDTIELFPINPPGDAIVRRRLLTGLTAGGYFAVARSRMVCG